MILALSILTAWFLSRRVPKDHPALDPNCLGILSALAAVAAGVGSALAAVGSAVGSAAGATAGALGSAAGAVGSAVGSAAGAAGGALGSAASSVGGALGSAASTIGSGVGQAAGAVGQAAGAVGEAVGSAGSAIGQGASSAGQAIAQGAQGVGQGIAQGAQSVGQGVSQAAGQIGQATSNVTNSVVQGLTQAGESVGNVGQAVGKSVAEGAQSAGKGIMEGAKSVGSSIKSGAKSIGQEVSSFGKGLTNSESLQGLSSADLTTMAQHGVELGEPIVGGSGGTISPGAANAGQQVSQGAGKIGELMQSRAGGQGGERGTKEKIGDFLKQLSKDDEGGQQAAPAPPPTADLGAALMQILSMPRMAQGGQVPPGQPAVVGEAGPEVATGGPQGLAVQPVPAAAVPAVQQPQQPQQQMTVSQEAQQSAVPMQPTLGPTGAIQFPQEVMPRVAAAQGQTTGQKVANHLMAGLIGALNPEALTGMRKANAALRQRLVSEAMDHPELLEVSPAAVDAFERSMGAGSAQEYLERKSDIGKLQRNVELVRALGPLAAEGIGVSAGPRGLTLTKKGTTPAQAGELWAMTAFDIITDQGLPAELARNMGMESIAGQPQDDFTAGRAVMKLGTLRNMLVPTWIRELALADTLAEKEAAVEAAKFYKKNQLLRMPQVQEALTAESAAKARGKVEGEAAARAEQPFRTLPVQRPDSFEGDVVQVPFDQAEAFAVTGTLDSVDLGKNPSKSQMAAAVRQGRDLVFGPKGNLISVPIGSAWGGGGAVPASQVAMGADAIPALRDVENLLDDMAASKEFQNAFPSEAKFGQEVARGAGFAQSYVRRLTDSPNVLNLRSRTRQLGFRMARLLGSNSQLSDAERENAQAVWQPIIDGTATQEQLQEAMKSTRSWLDAIENSGGGRQTLSGGLGGRVPGAGHQPGRRGAPAAPSALQGSFASQADFADALAAEVEAGNMTKAQAEDELLNAMEGGLPQ